MSYISLAPELAEVRASLDKIFPTALGVRLSNRMSSSVFDSVIAEAVEVSKYDDARAGTIITELTNRLKGDSIRVYEVPWREQV